MAEPTTTTTLIATAAAVPALTVLGVPLGLRPDLLIAGFSGGLVAIVLLNSVPVTGDSYRDLIKASFRRTSVALASSLTAGYLAPITLLAVNLPQSLLLGVAFVVGGGAQQVLTFFINKFSNTPIEKA